MNARELLIIGQIAERAVTLYQQLGILQERNQSFARMAIADELVIVHREIVPLRLAEMLAGSDFDFAHDIGGIHRHLVHGTRTQKASFSFCFLPRFAETLPQKEKKEATVS